MDDEPIGWVAIGFIDESKLLDHITHMTVGHGFYCFSNNGHSWKSERSPSNLKNGFTWDSGDIVSCAYDGKSKTVICKLIDSIQGAEEQLCFITEIPNEDKKLIPIVLLHQYDASATILMSGTDWSKQRRQILEENEKQKKIKKNSTIE